MPTEPEVPSYLAAQLHDALVHDPRVAEGGIDVTVAGRRVFLTGTVPTDERRVAVAEVAAEVLPDHEIVNNVSVYCLDDPRSMEALP